MEIKILLRQISSETNHAGMKEHCSFNFWVVFGRFQVNTQRKNLKIFTQCIETQVDSWMET